MRRLASMMRVCVRAGCVEDNLLAVFSWSEAIGCLPLHVVSIPFISLFDWTR